MDFIVAVETGTKQLPNGKHKAVLLTEGHLLEFEEEFDTKKQALEYAMKMYQKWIGVMESEAQKLGFSVKSL